MVPAIVASTSSDCKGSDQQGAEWLHCVSSFASISVHLLKASRVRRAQRILHRIYLVWSLGSLRMLSIDRAWSLGSFKKLVKIIKNQQKLKQQPKFACWLGGTTSHPKWDRWLGGEKHAAQVQPLARRSTNSNPKRPWSSIQSINSVESESRSSGLRPEYYDTAT